MNIDMTDALYTLRIRYEYTQIQCDEALIMRAPVMSMFIEGIPLFFAEMWYMDSQIYGPFICFVIIPGLFFLYFNVFPKTIWKRQFHEGTGWTIH